jgi:hypothetical protein
MGYFGLILLTAMTLAVQFFLIHSLRSQFSLMSSFFEIKGNIVELPKGYLSDVSPNNVVHFSTDDIKASIHEQDFNLLIDNAMQLKRSTEYCQWNEIAFDKCETCYRDVRQEDGKTKSESYSCNCVRTYNYIKKWGSYRINSLLFNQPAAHYNPQRDPYPSSTFYAQDPVIDGSVVLERGLVEKVKGASKYLNFGSGHGSIPQNLVSVYESSAYKLHHFVYAGNGYFFSPYEVSTQERLMKMFFQWMEGSILDFQIGDLMPSCTAGDIRVSYYSISPQQISGLGRLSLRNGARASIGLYTTAKAAIVGLLREGMMSSDQLMDAEVWDFKKMVYWSRLALFVWSFIPANLVKAYVGCLTPLGWTNLGLNALAITGILNFGVELTMMLLFASDIGVTGRDLVGLGMGLGISLCLFLFTVMEWKKTGDSRYGGLGASMRLIYRYCGGPVSWYEAPVKPELFVNKPDKEY